MRPSLESLAGMDRPALVNAWKTIFGGRPPPNTSQDMMRLIVGWEVQAKMLRSDVRELKSALRALDKPYSIDGDQAPVIKRKMALSPGTRLSREWQGRTFTVDVLDKGYVYDGKLFTSLSPIAKTITGSHRSGPLFFGVSQ